MAFNVLIGWYFQCSSGYKQSSALVKGQRSPSISRNAPQAQAERHLLLCRARKTKTEGQAKSEKKGRVDVQPVLCAPDNPIYSTYRGASYNMCELKKVQLSLVTRSHNHLAVQEVEIYFVRSIL